MQIGGATPSALTFARLLGEGPMARVALEASLEGLPGMAFIVSSNGTVLFANRAGAARTEAEPDGLRSEIAASIASLSDPGKNAAALVTRLQCEGAAAPYFLLVFRAPSSVRETVKYVSQLWELTPRQHEVLALVAEGFSNKTIGVRLGCTERTVETHLTAVFQKSGFDGRNALLAALARRAG